MAKNNAVGAESDDLGKVIKNLIDFDAKQRVIVSDSLKKRDEERKALENAKDEINAKHIKLAQDRLDALEKRENENAERLIKAAQAAAKKNIAEFDRTAAEKWELIKEVFWRIFAPRAYANLYSHYQALRNSIDEMEEEARCDVVDAENEVRRLQRENRELQQRIDELTAQLQALKE